jgi:VWFA-related protein
VQEWDPVLRLTASSRDSLLLVAATGAVAALCAPGIGVLTQSIPLPSPQFRATADLIRLDVSVLDRGRQPVRDLTAADFTVAENGARQQIESFAVVELPEPATTPNQPPVESPAAAPLSDRRILVLVLDDAMVPANPQMVASVKEIARRTIEQLGQGDLATVVFTRHQKEELRLSWERDRLLERVDAFQSAGHVAGSDAMPEVPFFTASLETLTRVAEWLAAVPQRRKALVWVSVGVPLNMREVGDPTRAHAVMFDRLKVALDRALQAHVNVYAVDPGGLDGLRFHIEARERMVILNDDNTPEVRAGYYRDMLRTVADNTGGRAFVNTNEFATGVAQILRETGAFYLIGYQSSNRAADGRFRRITVRVNRPGATVRTRAGYYAPGGAR